MRILVVNAGSSSLKSQLIETDGKVSLMKCLAEKVGTPDAYMNVAFAPDFQKVTYHVANMTVAECLKKLLEVLVDDPESPISDLSQIDAIGNRIVAGGEYFTKSVIIDEPAREKLELCEELAPLHNPPADACIDMMAALMPSTPQVAVFDTAFHATMPPKAYMYPLPYELYEKHAIRKYGAHGTSHRYIAERAAAFMDEPLEDLKLITCHLGNGCSISAIDHGVAVDTSMGLTPLDGLMMGTRCGAIDPAIVPFIMEKENLTAAEVNDLMNKKSGLLGISGISNDLRSVRQASEEGDERAQLAYDMYSNSAKKYIGQYIAVMGGVDAIVLTAGVGENCDKMRRMIFAGLQPLGIKIDLEKNRAGLRGEREISTDDSEVRIVIIPTDEEYMIARDTYQLVKEGTLEITELV